MREPSTRSVRSSAPLDELRDRWSRPSPGARIAIFDLDGTVHRGVCYSRWRGLSVVDLSICLGVLLAVRPVEWFAFTKRVLRFRSSWRARRRRSDAVGVGHQVSGDDVFKFVDEVLGGLRANDVERAARFISRLSFRDALLCVRRIVRSCQRWAFVSRSISPVLSAYAARLGEGPPFELYGNALRIEGGIVRSLDPRRRVMTADDKGEATRSLLFPLRHQGRALIVANASEDVAMFDVADEVLGRERVLKIAMMPTDPELADRADVVASSWRELRGWMSA
jgi:hypothetical protein